MRASVSRSAWSWRSRVFRGRVLQVLTIAVLAAMIGYLAHNTAQNMRARGIQSGFGFLAQPAGFDIGETPIAYESSDPYWRAIAVGTVNTLRVATIGIVLATLIGTLVGIGRFSRNALVRGLCRIYVETFRNVPVLIQLFLWYLLITELLPPPDAPLELAGPVFLSKGGLSFPIPVWAGGHVTLLVGLGVGVAAAFTWRRWQRRRFEATGVAPTIVLPGLLLVLAGALVGWFAGGAPDAVDAPARGVFAIEGGGSLTPEFLAVLGGLTVYTAAFIAEVVRGGIASVPRGQGEAAQSLGLSRAHEMRLVLLPQALRVIVPPLTNQYLNLTKNSSLAVAIGYPDVVSILNTSLNQTGRAVECIAIVMLVYLTLSLATSAFMNWYNARSAIRER